MIQQNRFDQPEEDYFLGLDSSSQCCVFLPHQLQLEPEPGRISSFKVAFVKQDCYQDLWIGDSSDSPSDLLLSSQLRSGPVGLIRASEQIFIS
jgi:hypothetical protein